jgi:hypothetical protein
MPSLCVHLQRLGDQRVVPGFRCLLLLCMSYSMIPGPRRLHLPSSFINGCGLHPNGMGSASPNIPSNPLHEGERISGLPVSLSLRPAKLLASLTDPTPKGPTETFTPGLSTGQSPFPPPGITTMAAGRLHRRDLHPQEHQLASLQPIPLSVRQSPHAGLPALDGHLAQADRQMSTIESPARK